MKPNQIKRFTRAFGNAEVATPRFLMRWLAWEAYQYRTLVVACHARGWAIAVAEQAVDAARVSSMRTFRQKLQRVSGYNPDFVQSTWERLLVVESVRNKLVHGIHQPAPSVLDGLSEFVGNVVTGKARCFTRLRVKQPGGGVVEISPLDQVVRRKSRTDMSELLRELGVKQEEFEEQQRVWARIPRKKSDLERLFLNE